MQKTLQYYRKRPFRELTSKNDYHLMPPYKITPKTKLEGHENKGNDHQLKRLLIVKQILLISTFGNVWKTV